MSEQVFWTAFIPGLVIGWSLSQLLHAIFRRWDD